MLRVDLGPLRREGSVLVEARVPSDHGLWDDSGLKWASDVEVSLTASFAGTGEMIVRGRVAGVLDQECRRCLEPVKTEIEEDVTMVFLGDAPEGNGDAEVYAFDAGGLDLDLGQAVREELILAINPYVVCDPECRGLCRMCGTNLNEGACDCSEDEIDPRWEALRALKDR